MTETTEVLEPPPRREKPQQAIDYAAVLAPYRRFNSWRSAGQLALSLLLFVGCWSLAYWGLQVSVALTLLAAVPTALLIVKLFCIMHDCGHGSYFESRRANEIVGFALGVMTFTPYQYWRKAHAIHHARSGKLDRRGEGGEIRLMTVAEYRCATRFQRCCYRIYRHPLALFGIGPSIQFLLLQRSTRGLPKHYKVERASVHWTNLNLLLVIGMMCWLVGWWQFLLVHGVSMGLASSIGVWLFYVQHQYEVAYWKDSGDWNYVDAALDGSSYYRLPWILQWLTASIGLHHIHHLDSKIPNYRLQRCHNENPDLQRAPTFTLWQSFRCAELKLWEEETDRLVGFSAAK